jgi:type VI secretion system secreted protein VgrG
MEVTRLEFGPICINDHILKLNNKSLMSNNIYAALEQLGLTAQNVRSMFNSQIRL